MSVDPELLDRALTHRSYAYERGGLPTNERLEFLGDSVLGLVVTEHLFVSYPDLSEGQLAKLRAAVVNSRALADIARDLDLGSVIHLGRGRFRCRRCSLDFDAESVPRLHSPNAHSLQPCPDCEPPDFDAIEAFLAEVLDET